MPEYTAFMIAVLQESDVDRVGNITQASYVMSGRIMDLNKYNLATNVTGNLSRRSIRSLVLIHRATDLALEESGSEVGVEGPALQAETPASQTLGALTGPIVEMLDLATFTTKSRDSKSSIAYPIAFCKRSPDDAKMTRSSAYNITYDELQRALRKADNARAIGAMVT
eukprot:4371781-Amphidinium_carterae.2